MMKTVKTTNVINKLFVAFIAISVLLMSCDNDSNPNPEPEPEPREMTEGKYSGDLEVKQGDAVSYAQAETQLVIRKETNAMISIVMKQVRFSDKMPAMDITISGISIALLEAGMGLAGDSIVPFSNGRGVPQFTIGEISGLLTVNTALVTLKIGPYSILYVGILSEEAKKGTDYECPLTVKQTDATDYKQENIVITVDKLTDNTATITMHQVKFSPKMPMTLDKMIVVGVGMKSDANAITLTGDGIVPIAMNNFIPEYTITELTGTLTDETLNLSLKGGGNPLTYTGIVKK
ncbi:MAG: calycin-like domain-containing protein [Bacteroidales bacterium]|nr:calycin-like domain-containing protein [Bacteroidales bacterium]